MSSKTSKDLKTSGALINPHNRFLKQEEGETFEDLQYEEMVQIKSQFIEVYPKTIVNKVTSQDVGLAYSMNPYQGCEHGCTYCYARPTHEYWGYSAGLDFERKILVKMNSAELLDQALRKNELESNANYAVRKHRLLPTMRASFWTYPKTLASFTKI